MAASCSGVLPAAVGRRDVGASILKEPSQSLGTVLGRSVQRRPPVSVGRGDAKQMLSNVRISKPGRIEQQSVDSEKKAVGDLNFIQDIHPN